MGPFCIDTAEKSVDAHAGARARRAIAPTRGAARRSALPLLAGALALALTLVASRAAAEPSPGTAVAKLPAEIRVGMTPNYPPLVFKRNGELTGIEVDLARELARILNVKFVLTEVPWDELVDALDDHDIDVVMSGASVTERRKKRVHFTEPYLHVGQMALIRKSDLTKLSSPEAMNQKGVKVGVERLTTGAKYARENLNAATVVEFDSVDAGLAALRAKKIDFFIHDAPTVWRVTGRSDNPDPQLIGLYRPLTDEVIAWAVRKDDAATLGAALDGALEQMKSDGKLQAILDRWITVRKVTKEMSPAAEPAK